MGSDFAINAFAVNFKLKDGTVNQDVIEANNLGKRIFNRLSITNTGVDINTKPLILTSTQLSQTSYGTCLSTLKNRLGLKGDQDLYVLVNVVMSPWPTADDLTAKIARSLRDTIEDEVVTSQFRNTLTPDFHGFILRGIDQLFLVHLAMFNMEDHRFQLVITGDIPSDVMEQYVKARKEDPTQYYTLGTANKEIMSDILEKGEFDAVIDKGIPTGP